MKRNEFIKILAEKNVSFFHHGSKHDIYKHNITGKKVTVPRHREIDNKLANKILDELFPKI